MRSSPTWHLKFWSWHSKTSATTQRYDAWFVSFWLLGILVFSFGFLFPISYFFFDFSCFFFLLWMWFRSSSVVMKLLIIVIVVDSLGRSQCPVWSFERWKVRNATDATLILLLLLRSVARSRPNGVFRFSIVLLWGLSWRRRTNHGDALSVLRLL
jgi:hypothetical protein